MGDTTYLSWIDIENACLWLSQLILRRTDAPFDVIVAIQRGGCIPGVYLSHLMHISEFYSIGIRTTSSEDIKAPRLTVPMISGDSSLKNICNKRVLIVDDVTNTGETMRILKKVIERCNPLAYKTCTLVWDGSYKGSCPVDYYAIYTPDWVVFPWEKGEVFN